MGKATAGGEQVPLTTRTRGGARGGAAPPRRARVAAGGRGLGAGNAASSGAPNAAPPSGDAAEVDRLRAELAEAVRAKERAESRERAAAEAGNERGARPERPLEPIVLDGSPTGVR